MTGKFDAKFASVEKVEKKVTGRKLEGNFVHSTKR
jgi:hypothetical protein